MHRRIGLWFLALTLLVALGPILGASLAQRPQGPWLKLETSTSTGEVAKGESFLTTLTLRNEGTETGTVEAISTQLPAGTRYVGQAPGSDVADSAAVESEGLRWTGPFSLAAGAELTIRFWAVASAQAAPGDYSVQAAAEAGTGNPASDRQALTVVAATEATPGESPVPSSGDEMAPAMPSAVQVDKTATPALLKPGNPVLYTVTFSNDDTSPVALTEIADELPTGFEYVGLAYGSQIGDEPTDKEEPEIVWQGSWEVPAQGSLMLRYWVWIPRSSIYNSTTPYTNSVTANNGAMGPAEAEVMIDIEQVYLPLVLNNYTLPYFTVEKSAEPVHVTEGPIGETVTYTVRLANGGDDAGVLNTIEDTLPAGFVFLEEVSNIGGTPPTAGSTGKIVWNGPYTVPAHSQLTLVYRVRASGTPGTYVNTATATTLVGRAPESPATETVTVGARVLFEDDFEVGIDNWTVFTNYPRNKEEQWMWDIGEGYGGSNGYTHYYGGGFANPADGAHDALTMYLGEGSEEWTNYRFSTRFKIRQGPKIGVWFLGEYRDVDVRGQWLTGYYVMVRVRDVNPDAVELLQMRTEEEPGNPPSLPQNLYDFGNPIELTSTQIETDLSQRKWHQLAVEVEKISADAVRIKVYVEDELAIDYVDNQGSVFTQGTIGLRTYGSDNVGFAIMHFDDVVVEPLE